MIDGQRVLAVVPARSGSKSIPRKNLAEVGGVSILARAIQAAGSCAYIDRVLVSTDGEEIAIAARRERAEVVSRSVELSSDSALIKDVLVDLTQRLREDGELASIMVLLEPTACLREGRDIDACLEMMVQNNLDSIATFTEADPHPHRVWRINEMGMPTTFIDEAVPWLPRQKLPPAYRLNGGVYAFKIDGMIVEKGPQLLFGNSGAVVMSTERSIDIDNPVDLEIANALIK